MPSEVLSMPAMKRARPPRSFKNIIAMVMLISGLSIAF